MTQEELDKVIKLLEKQTSRTPIQLDRHWKGCPSCKEKLISHDKPNYCQWCGQKLDWGEEEVKCLDGNVGEADKASRLMNMDIVRKWARYCVCGTKMVATATGGWYCPSCHRKMKAILVKRVG